MRQIFQSEVPNDPSGAREGRPSARLAGKWSKRQDESGGLSALDSQRKHQEGRKEGRADGSGAKGQEATANDWKSRSEGIRSDWGGRGMQGWKERKKERSSCSRLEQQFGPIIKFGD